MLLLLLPLLMLLLWCLLLSCVAWYEMSITFMCSIFLFVSVLAICFLDCMSLESFTH